MTTSSIVIGTVSFLVALGSFYIRPRDTKWAIDLRLPRWLFFEPVIPVVWTVIFISGAASAFIIWEKEPGSLSTWLLMATYLLLEIVTVAYIPATLRFRSLIVGTSLGGAGCVIGILLTLAVVQISDVAALLLIPYLIWTPFGTWTTWKLTQLNPDAA